VPAAHPAPFTEAELAEPLAPFRERMLALEAEIARLARRNRPDLGGPVPASVSA